MSERPGHALSSVAVVIPAHNAEATLAEQVEALHGQDSDLIHEVIVVDSMSTDDTAEIVSRLSRAWPKVRLQVATRPGANAARNTGVQAADAEAILMCDADDVVAHDWVERLTECLHDKDVVRGRYSLSELNDADVVAARGDLATDDQITGNPMFGGLGGCCGFRREVWEELGGLNEQHYGADDMEFFWRAHMGRLRVAYVPEAVVHYRLRPDYESLYLQQRQWASSRALLFKEFGHLGLMPRRSARGVAKSWAWVALHLPDRWSTEPSVRGRWVRVHAHNVGYVRGSARHRVLYP